MSDENSILDIFTQLRQAAGGKDFTFLGRLVKPEQSFADVLSTIPIGELEALAKMSPLEIDLQRAKEIEIAVGRGKEAARRAWFAR